jgi:hypothetical protein
MAAAEVAGCKRYEPEDEGMTNFGDMNIIEPIFNRLATQGYERLHLQE